ncbi:MAG: CFI-box-CTERM domain-containing protein, partial [Candidatus Scatosoma sp.]
EDSEKLSEKTLSTPVERKCNFKYLNRISEIFDFKYKEDVEECFRKLQIKPVTLSDDHSVIQIKERDNLIDLSPCVGNYQEAVFFKNYDIDSVIKDIDSVIKFRAPHESPDLARMTFEEKILYLTSIETKQNRYNTQVTPPIVTEEERRRIVTRLNEVFSRDETVQCRCEIPFSDKENGETMFYASGCADVVKENVVYELKFVNDLMHEHYLQCACYIAALDLKKGILWNVKKNEAYEITLPDKITFLNAVTKTITKGIIHEYHFPSKPAHKRLAAIIDTETNWDNRVMSIGVVIFDGDTFSSEAQKYYIITPEYKRGGIYQSALHIVTEEKVCDRSTAVEEIKSLFQQYHIQCIFAYNAASDCILLPEFSGLKWYDVMKVAAYRQFNKTLPQDALYCTMGRLKSNYGLEALLRLQNGAYQEKHNAMTDALDTLTLMRQTGVLLETYFKVSAIQPRLSVSDCYKKSADNNRFNHLTRENINSYTAAALSKEKQANPQNVSNERKEQVTSRENNARKLQNVYPVKHRQPKKQGCYIATSVYGDYNCPEVWTLRRYRDCYLKTTWIGRVFVSVYYAISPILVKWFGNKKWFNKLWKKRLDRFVYKLNDKGVSSAPYSDIAAEISERLQREQ